MKKKEMIEITISKHSKDTNWIKNSINSRTAKKHIGKKASGVKFQEEVLKSVVFEDLRITLKES